jgi:hypothetical protein
MLRERTTLWQHIAELGVSVEELLGVLLVFALEKYR